eukprot:scaffold8421_cov114-Isochrysis_galbana.AAC.13
MGGGHLVQKQSGGRRQRRDVDLQRRPQRERKHIGRNQTVRDGESRADHVPDLVQHKRDSADLQDEVVVPGDGEGAPHAAPHDRPVGLRLGPPWVEGERPGLAAVLPLAVLLPQTRAEVVHLVRALELAQHGVELVDGHPAQRGPRQQVLVRPA